jgi:hypothetical protein
LKIQTVKHFALNVSKSNILGHRISTQGIEPDKRKADHIKTWPILKSASNIQSFLGLVRYLAAFLPKLATYTITLDELTWKECDKKFPGWKERHQNAFKKIKKLVTSTDCLTTIDHCLMPTYKIFVTTDASDTGDTLAEV